MRSSKSVYLRLNETEAILVEIQTVDPKCKKLQDRYVQEVIELLRDTVCTRLGQIHKKKEQQKNVKDSTGILTGTNVRVGYAFKNRPGNQTCLYSNSVMKYGKYSSDEDIDSLKVLSEKLLVYVQVLVGGSPKGMSQLLKRLSDVKHATGSSVSISSYFQKMSAFQRSQVQETGTKGSASGHDTQSLCSEAELGGASLHLTNSDPVKTDKAPPSEGRKRKIKSILKRGNFPGKKRKLTTDIDTVTGMKSGISVVVDMKSDSVESNFEENGEESDETSVGSVTDSDKPLVSELINEDDLPVNVSRVVDFKPSTFTVNTDTDESQTFTVSKVSVQNLAEIQQTNFSCKTIDLMPNDSTKCLDINDKREPDNLTDCVSVTNQNHGIDIMPVNEITGQSGNQSDSSDNSPLPSASFCAVKSSKRLSQFNKETLRDILNVVESKQEQTVPEQGSPKFIGKSGKRKDYLMEEDLNSNTKKQANSANSDESVTKKGNTVNTLKRFRYKRKFPKFSDSDSEDSLPEKKRQNVLPLQTNIFAVTNNRKALCKNMKISKDFFSESKSTKQPKLSFFTSSKKAKDKENVSENPTCQNEKFPNLDIELIQELSDFPIIKSEADIELLQEVKSLGGVEFLNEEQIRFLIRRNDTFLRQIFEGKVKCNRHEAYKEGGKRRRDLSFASRLGPYSDEQIDIVMECLMSLFCKNHHKYLDYIMKVLLPEMLISFHMEIHNTSHEESEKLLGPQTPEQVASS